MTMNYKQIYAKKREYEKRLLALCPNLSHQTGIYVWSRINENGRVDKYIGQAVDILNRQIGHLEQCKTHFDKSLRKHKLYSETNRNGWFISEIIPCTKEELNEKERYYIDLYKPSHNITSGGQNAGKTDINERNKKTFENYARWKKKGYTKAIEQVRVFFEKYLDYSIKGQPNKIKERKLAEFEKLLKGTIQNEDEKIDSEND